MEKKTSYIGVIIFIIIFAIVAIGITVVLANLNKKEFNNVIGEYQQETLNKENTSEKNEVIEVVLENDNGIVEIEKVVDESDLVVKNFGTEIYFKNNLTIKEEVYHEGEWLDRDLDYYINGHQKEVNYSLQVNYIQIDGLKDKNIQEQVNSDLKYKAINLAKQSNIESEVICVDSVVMGNFSNILSVFLSCYVEEKSENGQHIYISELRL